MNNTSEINKFLNAMNKGKGFDYLANYENYRDLSKDDLRQIAKELLYTMEHYVEIDKIKDVYEELNDNLREEEDE